MIDLEWTREFFADKPDEFFCQPVISPKKYFALPISRAVRGRLNRYSALRGGLVIMSNHVLRIFSYLPNPRVWKALIAADYLGVSVEVLGDKPKNLGNWLWDFDARELGEEEKPKTARTRELAGGVSLARCTKPMPLCAPSPTALCQQRSVRMVRWEYSNPTVFCAQLRDRHRMPGLYGRNAMDASRIDSFLDATLVFGREAQVYLLGIDGICKNCMAEWLLRLSFT